MTISRSRLSRRALIAATGAVAASKALALPSPVVPAYVPPVTPYLFNYDRKSYARWRGAIAKTRLGTADSIVFALGDSTSFGRYGSNYAKSGGDHQNSWTNRLAELASNYGLIGRCQNFIGEGNSGNPTSGLGGFDSRFSAGSWTITPQSISNQCPGGYPFNAGAATPSPLTWAPSDPIDTFVLYYAQSTGTATLSVQVDSNTATTLDTSGTAAFGQAIIPAGAVGAHTLKISWASGGGGYIMGVDAYNSTVSQVRILNAGIQGAQTTTWNNGSALVWGRLNGLSRFNPDLVLINLGINDWLFTGSVPTFVTNMQAIINRCFAIGANVMLVTPAPSAVAYPSDRNLQLAYVAAIKQLGIVNNIAVIDFFSYLGSYEDVSVLNYYGTGNLLHPSAIGYAAEAKLIADVIFNM